MYRLFAVIPHVTNEHKKKLKIPISNRKSDISISFNALLDADDTILFENNETEMTA